MPISVVWDNDAHCTLIVTVVKPYSWNEIIDTYQQVAVLISENSHPVDLIHDARLGVFPGLPVFKPFRQIRMMLPDNLQRCCLVGVSSLAHDLAVLYARSTGNEDRLLFRETIEDARRALVELRGS
jgi:hypothetical protein